VGLSAGIFMPHVGQYLDKIQVKLLIYADFCRRYTGVDLFAAVPWARQRAIHWSLMTG
jgi:hypothetical protein